MTSASSRTFAIPELLEEVFLCIVDWPDDLEDREDPRSEKTLNRASCLSSLLLCQRVDRSWRYLICGSQRLQRALFLQPDYSTDRDWQLSSKPTLLIYPRPASTAPTLNPLLQATFPNYHFRFWHLSLDQSHNRYCAYLIITRRDIPTFGSRQDYSFSKMLLSQPPCTVMEATIWEERDYETNDYTGRTRDLRDPVVRCENGLTMGYVHERVASMFCEHLDVAAIKLTTI